MIFQSFADGVNAYIDEVGDNLPVEYKLTGLQRTGDGEARGEGGEARFCGERQQPAQLGAEGARHAGAHHAHPPEEEGDAADNTDKSFQGSPSDSRALTNVRKFTSTIGVRKENGRESWRERGCQSV